MPVTIIDGRGSGNVAGVNAAGELLVSANVTVGSITAVVGSESFIPAGSVLMLGKSGTNILSLLTDDAGILRTTASVSVDVGSESVITAGSVQTYDPIGVGSSLITNFPTAYPGSVNQGTNPWIILGSVHQVNSTSVTVGSESFIPAGSVIVTNRVAGSIVDMPNITLNNPTTIGSYTTQGILGSVVVTSPINVSVGSESVITAGSVQTYDPVGIGSVLITNGSIQTYGTSVTVGSEAVITAGSVQTYNPIGIGSVLITNGSIQTYGTSVTVGSEAVITAGSVQTYNPVGIGSVLITNGSIQTYGTSVTVGSEAVITAGSVEVFQKTDDELKVQITSGSIQNYQTLGSMEIWQTTNSNLQAQVTQETNPWIILGSVRMIPGDKVAGSIVDMPVITTSAGSTVVTAQVAGRTYSTQQIIRISAGSPETFIEFGGVSRSVLVDVIGSNPVYFNFIGSANPANSGTGILYAGNSLGLDIEIGSISIQSSGATVTEVQIINIR